MNLCLSMLIAAVGAAPLSPASSTRPHGPRGPGGPRGDDFQPGAFVQRLAEAVDATSEQVTQLEAIATETRTALEAARDQRREAMREHRDELRDLRDQVRDAHELGDEEAARSLVEQIRTLIGPPPHELIAGAVERMKAVLTEEQRDEAVGLFREIRRHRQGGPRAERTDERRGPSQRPSASHRAKRAGRFGASSGTAGRCQDATAAGTGEPQAD